VAGSGHGCSPRGLLEEKGAEGNPTVVGGGRHGNGARPATSFNGGGYLLSTTRCPGQGEMEVGAALDAVESGRQGVTGGGCGSSMRRQFRALIRHRGEGTKGLDQERKCR
jgi:hypothetical protein